MPGLFYNNMHEKSEELSKDTETLSRNMTLQGKDLKLILNSRTCKIFYHEVRLTERNG